MNYELAKELKDAGFTQGRKGEIYLWVKGNRPFSSDHWKRFYCKNTKNGLALDAEWFYIPTLSELIEACGDWFDGLMNQHTAEPERRWVAMESRYRSLDECHFGTTPEEAVARLWLAINRKEV